ncbi:Poly [ADP-ribose] polymerase (PARP) [Psidium guajava]|nr:Poly [ADP-ribose] polymerase (PARP) [Psidium guajava]
MARDLKVDELRAELAQRGLSTTGTKPTLVRRLRAALTKENKQAADAVDSTVNGKRERDSDTPNGDSDGPSKLRAFDKFRRLGIQQLREEAQRRGVSSSGSKKELLERLCGDLEKESATANKLKEEKAAAADEVRTEKIITATKKGVAVLDQWLPDHIKANYHVLQQGDDVYDAMLNQTNVGDNNNKFYAIQLLESDDGAAFIVYYRWGRVGVRGQDKLQGPYTSRDTAINEFVLKFYAKTRNHWFNRKEFICYPKYYTWLEMDYGGKEEQEVVTEPAVTTNQLRESKLESHIAKFLSLICNISMMKHQMMEIGYNAEKLPLGKLSKSTILKGYDVLKRIADLIGQSDRKKLEQLSGEFYTVIPHDFGFKKMREFVIDTPQKLKSKLELVEALGEIEVASKLLRDDIGAEEDPLYACYQRLGCELTPLEVGSQEYMLIETYMRNTHAKTHSSYTVDIVQIFQVSREVETERFSKFASTSNRMLLWHGSRLTNWIGILSQGLRIAPPEAPASGYMFGKGVYFADMFSKSANYCYANSAAKAGVLLLCEVALGDMVELLHAKYDADKLPAGKLSTKGIGATSPDPSEAQALEDGIVVPLGRPKEQSDRQGDLLYNEYIVYNVDQIRMRYVVEVNFNIGE